MHRDKLVFVFCLILCLTLGACLSLKQPRTKVDFYTLEYDPPPLEKTEPLPVIIRLQRFGVAPTYNTNRLIYRDDSFEREAYLYHKWRANPGDLVSYFIGRDLRQSGLFKGVLAYDSQSPASFMLEGFVDEFLEWDEGNVWHAVLTISITLMVDNEPDISKRILFQKTYHAKEPSSKKHPQELAAAMSQAMSKISREVTMDIYNHLKELE
ncbi:MAG: membrane integrity-associated transporter subunit PqiC [Deltaproteobacteria bacterium]|nr:membrane integrity-associated transporter subunit PqiC [Deltaproteobacteria bacterium]